jgi:hypothetical protein
MARQPTMPKALSPLQSVQRSYTSEFSVVSQEEKRKGTQKEESPEFGSYQCCSGFRIELRVGV